MSSHGPSPIYVWLSGSARSRVEAIARKEDVPAAHVAGRLLAEGVGVRWTEAGRACVGFRQLRAANSRKPNSVYVTASPQVVDRIRTAARVNGMTVSRFASSRIYASLGIRFVAPTMGKPVVRTAEDIRRQRRVQAAKHYAAHRDEINAARRTENLSPEARERRNARAREYNREYRRRVKAELLESHAGLSEGGCSAKRCFFGCGGAGFICNGKP